MAQTRELLERIAVGIERLAEDPVIHMETAPPVCPHCERINPVIRVEESQATGLMAEYVVKATCQSCNGIFYSAPLQWACAKSISEISKIVNERAEIGGYSNGNSGQDQRA